METYQSHKRVKAARIAHVNPSRASNGEITGTFTVTYEDGSGETLPREMTMRHHPVVGDYLVEYEDGYRSISPKAAFEGGYTKVADLAALPSLTVTASVQDPSLGRIVHYVMLNGEIRPAIIVRVWQPIAHPSCPGMSNLQVYLDGQNDVQAIAVSGPPATMWQGSVFYSADMRPGTWHWPPRT